MNIVLIVLSAYLAFVIICMSVNKCNFYNANKVIYNNCKKIYEFFQTNENGNPQNIRFPINITVPEGQNFCKNINKLVESSTLVKINNDKDFIYFFYKILGIKDKFVENQTIATKIIENELSGYLSKINNLNFSPIVICDSFIEGQLYIKVAISPHGEELIQNKLNGGI